MARTSGNGQGVDYTNRHPATGRSGSLTSGPTPQDNEDHGRPGQVRTDAVRQALWQRNRTTAAGHHQRHRNQSKPHPRIVARPCPALDPTNCHQTAQRSRPHPAGDTPFGHQEAASTDPATSWRAGASAGDHLPARPPELAAQPASPAGRGHTWTGRSIIRSIHEQIVAIYWQGLQVRHRKR